MNWILRNTKKINFHTNLSQTLKPILEYVENYNWFLCDLDFIADKSLPINFDEDSFKLNSEEFLKIVNSETQIIWGVISAVPKNIEIEIDKNNLPFVEGNEMIWKNDNFQVKNSEIEIIAFDSSFTIVKFKNQTISEKFKTYFEEAIILEEFK